MTCLTTNIMVIFFNLPPQSPENKKKGSFKFLLLSDFHVVPHSMVLFEMCETECLVFELLPPNAVMMLNSGDPEGYV